MEKYLLHVGVVTGGAIYGLKGHKLYELSPDDVRILIDMGLVEMRDDVPVVTPAGYAEIS